jgi:hypothetical protein
MTLLPSRRRDWRTYANLAAALTERRSFTPPPTQAMFDEVTRQLSVALGAPRAQREALASLIELEAAKLDEDAAFIVRMGLDAEVDVLACRTAAGLVRWVVAKVDECGGDGLQRG